MTRSLRTLLFLLALVTASSSLVQARMVIGVTPAVMPGASDRAVLTALEEELGARLGEAVRVRSFETDAAQLDWLIRFRELDAALISNNLLRTLPAGTLIHLADLPAAVAVTHPGSAAASNENLRRIFRTLAEDDPGRRLLNRLSATAKLATSVKIEPARQVVPALPKPAVATLVVRPTTSTTSTTPATALTPKIVAPTVVPVAPPDNPPATTRTSLPPAKGQTVHPYVPLDSANKSSPSTPPPLPATPGEASSSRRSRLLLIAALVLVIGIAFKIALLIRYWEQKKKAQAAPPASPSAETFDFQATDAQSVTAPAVAVSASTVTTPGSKAGQTTPRQIAPGAAKEPPQNKRAAAKRNPSAKTEDDIFPAMSNDLVVEQGRLGRTKVPALLKRCADLPQPVILRVRTQENETCVHFAAGQICHAYSSDWRITEGTGQWSKLGYLMVREGLISETQRDQALEMIERQEGLRFPAALQQLGSLKLEALRNILARQAKTTLFALILFSSGEYRIEADSGAIPAEESIALQVDALIREASHHQAEWTSIRKTLPNLGTLLEFTPAGSDKLDQVRLSAHQQLLLSQIDGPISVGTLCSSSTMMDYEVCRFLYLMIKAGVLQVVPAA